MIPKLLASVVLILVVVEAQQQHPSNNRWVWSQRAPEVPNSQQFAQRRIAAIDSNTDSFRSISARSYPNAHHPANVLLDNTKKQMPKVVTPGLYPYPFDAKPIELGDGTSIGFAPHDTLPVVNGHSGGHRNQINEHEDKTTDVSKDERYTTLDKLNSGRIPVSLPDPHSYSKEILGGLHPDEVFYADNDLMIIKGGGFHAPYEGDNHIDSNIKKIKTTPVGNDLGDAHFSEQPTRVRPTEIFSKVPLPFRFVNGNIPTVIKGGFGPVSRKDNFQHNSFQPSSGFRPIFGNNYRALPSNVNIRRVQLTKDVSEDRLQRLNNDDSDEIFVAEPSHVQPVIAHVAKKRSANPKVVHYHYQTRGSTPIVNYQVHNDGQLTKGNLQIQNSNKNNIARTQNKEQQFSKGIKTGQQNSQPDFSELEDLSGGDKNSLIPTVQTPRLRPGTQLPISLRGDTDVNFLEPRPRENPLADRLQPTSLPTLHSINRQEERQPTFFVPSTRNSAPTARFTEPTSRPRSRNPAVRGLNRQGSNRRFVEPIRRRAIRQKSLSPKK